MDTLNIGINKPEEPKDGKGIIWGAIAIIVVVALLIYFIFLRGVSERTAPPTLTEEERQILIENSTAENDSLLTEEEREIFAETGTSRNEESFLTEEERGILLQSSSVN